jgi:hypothetical protein
MMKRILGSFCVQTAFNFSSTHYCCCCLPAVVAAAAA